MTMTDIEVRDQIARAGAFAERLRDAIAAMRIDPASLCADAQRRTLRRITDTLDQIEFITLCNMSNLDLATNGILMSLIEIKLMACGTGRDMDFADAASFLRTFQPVVDMVLKRRIN